MSTKVLFRTGSMHLAIDAAEVVGIISYGDLEVSKTDHLTPETMGIASIRGNIVTLISSSLLLGSSSVQTSDLSVILIEHDAHQIGLVVDEIEFVQDFYEGALIPMPDLIKTDLFSGLFAIKEKITLLISVEKLIEKFQGEKNE